MQTGLMGTAASWGTGAGGRRTLEPYGVHHLLSVPGTDTSSLLALPSQLRINKLISETLKSSLQRSSVG